MAGGRDNRWFMNQKIKDIITQVIDFIVALLIADPEVVKRRATVDKTHANMKEYLKKYKK